jgi:hypothetical protein
MCARFVDRNYGESGENICGKCCKMKDHLELLINELKSSQLIIKILQEEIELASTTLKIQDNLTNDDSHPTSGKDNAWKVIRRTRAPSMKHKRHNHTDLTTTNTLPLLLNHYDPLCNDSVSDKTPVGTQESKMAKSKHTGKHKTDRKQRVLKEKQLNKQQKVIVVGDSHARGCATEVNHLLKNDFEVLGFVNPGSGMKYIKDTSKVKLQQLSKEDVVVLWGGSNDIAKNSSTVGMRHLLDFVINVTHTNVIVMSAPHRHDLMSNSCVNKEIEKFNRKLHSRLERLRRVEMIDVVNDRNLYTRHGQHLNTEGKETMAKKIGLTKESVLNKQVELITGKWYTDKAIDALDHQPAQSTIDNNNELEINKHSSTSGGLDTLKVQDAKCKCDCEFTSVTIDRNSPKRPRRQPVTRSSDFLWTDTYKYKRGEIGIVGM